MKKILSLCLVATMFFALGSCTKEAPNQGGNPFASTGGNVDPGTGGGGGDPEPAPSVPVGDVPASFTKKVLIEKLTGEWCGVCPSGGVTIDNIVAANTGKAFAASWQMSNGDPFQIPESLVWRPHILAGAGIGSIGFPSVSVSRNPSISSNYAGSALDAMSNCGTQVTTELAKTADCGLALVTSEEGDKANVDVYIGFNNPIATANTHLTIFLIEDDVPESNIGAQAGAPDGYLHKHMVRDVITADLGDIVNLNSVSATKYIKLEYKDFDIAGKYHNKENLSILAFVNIKESAGDQLGVLNVQQVKLGEIKKFD